MTYKVVTRYYDTDNPSQQFSIHEVRARNRDKAMEIVDDKIGSNISLAWTLTLDEFEALKKVINTDHLIEEL